MESQMVDGTAIEARALTKRYGGSLALDGFDLAVPLGGVYGLLGPNGAGKTTLVRLLATLVKPDQGQARVLGHDVVADPRAVRERIALTGQYASVDADLTGRENLILNARLLGYGGRGGRRRADHLLDAFGLGEAADRPVKTYSGGMRRRLDLAASIVRVPELLFLDEPTTGLDPRSRSELWDVVRGLVRDGTTVLLTTQYLEEADQLADRIGVMDHGALVAEGTPGQLKASVGVGTLHLRLADAGRRPEAQDVLSAGLGVAVEPSSDPAGMTAPVADLVTAIDAIAALSRAGLPLSEFAVGQPSLDEVFLSLTGQSARSEQEVA
jgi:ABC-2 type transport system ATP-binding protein